MDWGMLTLYITTFALRYSTDFNVEFAQEYFEEEDSWKVNKAGYTAQDAPSMRTFHLRK